MHLVALLRAAPAHKPIVAHRFDSVISLMAALFQIINVFERLKKRFVFLLLLLWFNRTILTFNEFQFGGFFSLDYDSQIIFDWQ